MIIGEMSFFSLFLFFFLIDNGHLHTGNRGILILGKQISKSPVEGARPMVILLSELRSISNRPVTGPYIFVIA